VIQSFRRKGLRDLFLTGASAGVRPDLQNTTPKRYAISVNGPWRITFEWMEGDAWRVDLEQYH
jgi:proteic killer suppression protein